MNAKPIIALVGRPNVGKSTLFNRLTRSRDAIVDDQPGVTRDRLYGEGRIGGKSYWVVDTGGVGGDEDILSRLVEQQVEQVTEEADVILFIVNAREGLTPLDEDIAQRLRQVRDNVRLVVNKTEGFEIDVAMAEFQRLGLGEPTAISAIRGDGVEGFIQDILHAYPEPEPEPKNGEVPRVAIIGRPNVGKSTLVNRLAGDDRVIVYDLPGTTRDLVRVPIERSGKQMILLDTAGVRRRSRIHNTLEQFSVVKTLQALDLAHVAILVLDASETVTEQDAAIAGLALEAGRTLVIAVNKWDGLPQAQKIKVKKDLERKLPFLAHAECKYISALHGTGVGELLKAANRAYHVATIEVATSNLNRCLQRAIEANSPPSPNGRPIKLKFAHQSRTNPPVIVIHGNQIRAVPTNYRRYLENYFRQAYRLRGVPVKIILRQAENPFTKRRQRQGVKSKKSKHLPRRH